jgi:hypothetical protein
MSPENSATSGDGKLQPQFLGHVISAEYEGEEIEIWNELTVVEHHYVMSTQIESDHEISRGDATGMGSPDYITPEMDDQLRHLDVYPNAEVVDPRSDEVTIL